MVGTVPLGFIPRLSGSNFPTYAVIPKVILKSATYGLEAHIALGQASRLERFPKTQTHPAIIEEAMTAPPYGS
jgi:hypothetical protein